MPFQSQAQRAYMYIHHPDIAKRWTREYGGGGHLPYKVGTHKVLGHKGGKGGSQSLDVTPTGTPSNESWAPQISVLGKKPGMSRDYGMLKPSSSGRFIPRSEATPNEHESTQEKPVRGIHGSHPPYEHNIPVEHPKGLAGRDVRTAFNREVRRVHG